MKRLICSFAYWFCVLALTPLFCLGEPQPAAIFGDHMVLQRDVPVPVWGTADPGKKVVVTFAGQTKTAVADAEGKWMVRLDPMPTSSEGRRFSVQCSVFGVQGQTNSDSEVAGKIILTDILVGDVFLCSGQSNMVWPVRNVTNAKQEIATAGLPLIRHNGVQGWDVCSSNTVGRFSGTAFFFGRALQRHLGIPIGLITRAVGGTRIEAWMSRDALLATESGSPLVERAESTEAREEQTRFKEVMAEYYEASRKWFREQKDPATAGGERPTRPAPPAVIQGITGPNGPHVLYDQHIAPLVPYAIRGAIWYQGERNARVQGGPAAYRELLPAMISSWRAVWGEGDFPFLFVQLPNYGGGTQWPEMREAMQTALATPNTAMAVTIDVGETRSIHPRNKQDVGERLALAARHLVYGEDLVWTGPVCDGMVVRQGIALLHFEHAGSGLIAHGDTLTGFEIADANGEFTPAQAKIEGPDTVAVANPDIPKPTAVRYAWAPDPVCNLYNKEALPAAPFRMEAKE